MFIAHPTGFSEPHVVSGTIYQALERASKSTVGEIIRADNLLGSFPPQTLHNPSIRIGIYQFSGLFCYHPNGLSVTFKKGIIMMHS